MKTLLLLLAFLIPAASFGQRWHVSAGGGLSMTSSPSSKPIFNNTDIRISGVGNVQVERSIGNNVWLGLNVSVANLARGREFDVTGPNPVRMSTVEGIYHLASPAVILTPQLSVYRNHFFAGPQVGVIVPAPGKLIVDGSTVYDPYFRGSAGFAGGLHGGYMQHITKTLSFTVEARTNYIVMPIRELGGTETSLSFFQTQLTGSLTYTIF